MAHPEVLDWHRLTKARFDEIDRANAVVMVTCSPLEVHGPHLPLGADPLEGEGLAERVLRFLPQRHLDRDFLKLPFIYAATDPVPQPGSLRFQPSTTVAVLEDLGDSLAAQGFGNVLVSNFHGSPRHFVAIEKACHAVTSRSAMNMVPIFSIMISRLSEGSAELGEVLGELPGVTAENFDGDTHGGLVETSQLLALHPELVDESYVDLACRTMAIWRAEKGIEHEESTASGIAAVPSMVKGARQAMDYFSTETYSGDPSAATGELGESILDTLAEHTATAVAEILDGSLPPERWHSPAWPFRHLMTQRQATRAVDAAIGVSSAV